MKNDEGWVVGGVRRFKMIDLDVRGATQVGCHQTHRCAQPHNCAWLRSRVLDLDVFGRPRRRPAGWKYMWRSRADPYVSPRLPPRPACLILEAGDRRWANRLLPVRRCDKARSRRRPPRFGEPTRGTELALSWAGTVQQISPRRCDYSRNSLTKGSWQ